MKKNLLYIMSLWLLVWLWFLCICNAQRYFWWDLETSMPYLKGLSTNDDTTGEKTELWDRVSIKEIEEGSGTIIIQLLNVFWLDDGRKNWRDLVFIDYAKAIINMALWLVAFIALIMSLYTFYMMFFTENEAWIKKAKWNLVGIFIALGILWLAWIIVSFIFRRYQSNWKDEEKNLFPEAGSVALNYTDTLDNQIYLTI